MTLSDRISAAYVRALASSSGPGEPITLRRGAPPNNTDYALINAWVTGYTPQEIAGGIQEGNRKAIVLASDVIASGFPLPFLPKQDRLIWGGVSNAIISVDDATRRVQGIVIAYEIELSGA